MSDLPPMPQHLRDIFNAAFLFRRRHLVMENTPEAWEACAAEMGDFAARLGGDPLAVDMLAAVYQDIERQVCGRVSK